MKRLALPLFGLTLTACATPGPATPEAAATGSQVKEIASTPLNDLNLVRAEIPAVLVAARRQPYGAPGSPGCAAIAADIQALDEVLGADLDVPPNLAEAGLIERGSNLVGEAAIDAVRGAAAGVVPFRSWVRKLTGAERHAKEAAAAIAAGVVRRAYLKGLGQAAGCTSPAAPRLVAAP